MGAPLFAKNMNFLKLENIFENARLEAHAPLFPDPGSAPD
jgi:hypothetical protein